MCPGSFLGFIIQKNVARVEGEHAAANLALDCYRAWAVRRGNSVVHLAFRQTRPLDLSVADPLKPGAASAGCVDAALRHFQSPRGRVRFPNKH